MTTENTTATSTPADATVTTPAGAPAKEGMNWGSVAKNVGIASLGAAAGAAGMWAWKR